MEDKEEDHPVMKTCFEKNLPLPLPYLRLTGIVGTWVWSLPYFANWFLPFQKL